MPATSRPFSLACVVLALTVSCDEPRTSEDTSWSLESPRVLAVRATPAEATPGESVHFEALYADASGSLATAPLVFTFCNARKPLTELGPVAVACLDPKASDQVFLAQGRTADAVVARDVCQRFGPNPPQTAPGETGRPVDPDSTGGYYQPTMVFRTDDPAADPVLERLRVSCGVADAPSAIVSAFQQRYHRNENPRVLELRLERSNESVVVPEDGAGPPPSLAAGETAALVVRWPACPSTGSCGDGVCTFDEGASSCAVDCRVPMGCEGAETYAFYDAASATLVGRHESMQVAWYATDGALADPRTGREDDSTESANLYTAPEAAGEVVVFVVLHDERGGTDFHAYRFVVP